MPSIKQSNRVTTVYEPNHIMKAGIRIWPEMFLDLADFRGLIWKLVVRDLSARYKKSVLGIFWAFLAPLVMMIVYPPPTSWPLSFLINTANPVSGFVTAARDLTTVGYLTDPANYALSVIISILIFLAGWRLFHLVEPKVAERI